MHWLWMRPLSSWAAFLVIHAIGIPLIYAMGKARGSRQVKDACPTMAYDPHPEQ